MTHLDYWHALCFNRIQPVRFIRPIHLMELSGQDSTWSPKFRAAGIPVKVPKLSQFNGIPYYRHGVRFPPLPVGLYWTRSLVKVD
jgi:hypothetical protein